MSNSAPLVTAALIQAGAAAATFLIACVAVWITWKAPLRAAELAERLRSQNEALDTQRQEKMRIFRIMMNYRGRNISAVESVDALNMINVAFHDVKPVREAYENFLGYANGAEFAQHRTDAYLDILTTMAADLGFADSVSRSDINRGYYPKT